MSRVRSGHMGDTSLVVPLQVHSFLFCVPISFSLAFDRFATSVDFVVHVEPIDRRVPCGGPLLTGKGCHNEHRRMDAVFMFHFSRGEIALNRAPCSSFPCLRSFQLTSPRLGLISRRTRLKSLRSSFRSSR